MFACIKKKIFFLLLIFISVLSCDRSGKSKLDIILENPGYNHSLVNLNNTNNYDYIVLETTHNSRVSSYDKILMSDNCIVIADKSVNNEIFIFDKKGCFINKINSFNEDFREISDISLNNENIVLFDNVSDKFIYYDLYGNYQRTIWINDNIINSFITLADKCLAFFVDIPGYTENNDEIIIVDSLGEIVNSFITRPSNDLLHGRFDNDTYFATSDSGVYFIPMFDDKIYSLNKDSIELVFNFDIFEKMITYDDLRNETTSKINKFSFINNFYITSDGFFTCSTSLLDYYYHICGNVNSGNISTWNGIAPIKGVYKNNFIMPIYGEILQQYIEDIDTNPKNNMILLLINGSNIMS